MQIARNSDTLQPLVRDAGPALFRLVRYWSRRWMREDRLQRDDRALDIVALEAAETASRQGSACVGDIAAQLGIDRSGASRLITSAIEHGVVTRSTSSDDARRAELRITPAGRRLLVAAHKWQSATFLQLVADWDTADVYAFASYLIRLADQVLTKTEGDQHDY